jgi:hypothetical protein
MHRLLRNTIFRWPDSKVLKWTFVITAGTLLFAVCSWVVQYVSEPNGTEYVQYLAEIAFLERCEIRKVSAESLDF